MQGGRIINGIDEYRIDPKVLQVIKFAYHSLEITAEPPVLKVVHKRFAGCLSPVLRFVPVMGPCSHHPSRGCDLVQRRDVDIIN